MIIATSKRSSCREKHKRCNSCVKISVEIAVCCRKRTPFKLRINWEIHRGKQAVVFDSEMNFLKFLLALGLGLLCLGMATADHHRGYSHERRRHSHSRERHGHGWDNRGHGRGRGDSNEHGGNRWHG